MDDNENIKYKIWDLCGGGILTRFTVVIIFNTYK